MSQCGYGFVEETGVPFDEAVRRAEAALAAEGFGVVCRIDMQAKLKEKLGVDVPPYLILGACKPATAHLALAAEPDLGLLLPCNVVVYERDGRVRVGAVDAVRLLSLVGNPQMEPMAREVNAALQRAVSAAAHG